MLRILRGLGGDSTSLQSWRNFRHALAEFCGRVPTHFAHNQKDWTGKDITVKGEGEEQTEENANAYRRARNKSTATKARVATATLDKAMATKTWEPPGAWTTNDHWENYWNHFTIILGSLDLVLNMITQTTNWFHKHFGLTQHCAEYDNTSGKFAHGRAESFFQFAFYLFYICDVRRLCGVASTPSTPPTPIYVTVFANNLAD